MKISLGDLRDARKALDVIFNQELDITMAFKLSKLLKTVDKELKDLEDFRLKLIQKYGEQDKEKNMFAVKGANEVKFYAEFGKLLDTSVDIKFTKIPLKDLAGVKITPNELALLEPFIKEK